MRVTYCPLIRLEGPFSGRLINCITYPERLAKLEELRNQGHLYGVWRLPRWNWFSLLPPLVFYKTQHRFHIAGALVLTEFAVNHTVEETIFQEFGKN